MPDYALNLGLSALPEIEQKKEPQIYAELVRIRNALNVLNSLANTLAGGTPGQVLTKVGAGDFDYQWI